MKNPIAIIASFARYGAIYCNGDHDFHDKMIFCEGVKQFSLFKCLVATEVPAFFSKLRIGNQSVGQNDRASEILFYSIFKKGLMIEVIKKISVVSRREIDFLLETIHLLRGNSKFNVNRDKIHVILSQLVTVFLWISAKTQSKEKTILKKSTYSTQI